MAMDRNHYNYHPLDKLFTEGLDPQYLGDQLDEIMFRLVLSAGDDYHQLGWHYYLLLLLRDMFWALKPVQA